MKEIVNAFFSKSITPFLMIFLFRYYTITFVNDKCLSKSDVWYIFSKVGVN